MLAPALDCHIRVQVAKSGGLDPLLMISVRDARDSLERQLRMPAAVDSASNAVAMALDEATGLLMDLDAALSAL